MAVSTAQSITCPKPSPSRAPGGREQNKVSPPRSSDFQLQISNFRFPTSDFQLQISNPAVVGLALLADLLVASPLPFVASPLPFVASPLPPGVDEFDVSNCVSEAVYHAQKRRLCQKAKALPESDLSSPREPPAGEKSGGALASSGNGLQHGLRMFSLAWLAAWLANVFVGMACSMACECFRWHGLRMFLLVGHGIINTAEQFRGKIVDGHRLGLALQVW